PGSHRNRVPGENYCLDWFYAGRDVYGVRGAGRSRDGFYRDVERRRVEPHRDDSVMARDGSTVLDWGPDTFQFRLGWAELQMLQEATDMGPWLLQSRLEHRTCKIGEIADVMRCGLLGGGVDPVRAKKLVDQYVKGRPPSES